jgi:hypothetical protein
MSATYALIVFFEFILLHQKRVSCHAYSTIQFIAISSSYGHALNRLEKIYSLKFSTNLFICNFFSCCNKYCGLQFQGTCQKCTFLRFLVDLFSKLYMLFVLLTSMQLAKCLQWVNMSEFVYTCLESLVRLVNIFCGIFWCDYFICASLMLHVIFI